MDEYVGRVWEFKSGGTVTVNNVQSAAYTIDGDDITIMGGMLYGKIKKLTNNELILDLKLGASVNGNPPDNAYYEFSKM